MALSPKDEQRETSAAKPNPKPKPMTMSRAAQTLSPRPGTYRRGSSEVARRGIALGMGPAPLQERQASGTCTATASQRL